MLVVVNRNDAAILFEHLDTLFEKFVARVEDLPLFILRIITVLSDEEYGVHCQLIAAATQGLRDGGIDRETEFLRAFGALVALRLLVHVQRHHLHVGTMPLASDRIADQEPVRHMLRVRQVAIDGSDYGYAAGHGSGPPERGFFGGLVG